MDVLTLDMKGVALAVALAILMLYFGGWQYGWTFVAVMVFFLVLSAIVTRLGMKYKKNAKLYQETRGVKNVMANGLGPLIFALLVYVAMSYDMNAMPFVVGFIASAAAVAADKFSSEIGVLNGAPTSIVTFRKLRKGTSGGVTWLGLSAGLIGSLLVAMLGVTLVFAMGTWNCPSNGCGGTILHYYLLLLLYATIGGAAGTVTDSYLGHLEERNIGSKYTSNFFCSIAGGVVAMALIFVWLI